MHKMYRPNTIEYYESLPFRESMRVELKWWGYHGGHYTDIDNVSTWTVSRRIIEKYLGKSYDEAFSHYCQIAPKYAQYTFDDNLEKGKWFIEEYLTYKRYAYRKYYYIDDNGILCKTPKAPIQPSTYYSDDYRSEKVPLYQGNEINWDKYHRLKREGKEGLTTKDKIMEGRRITYNSTNHPEYKKLMAEQMQKKKSNHKYWLEEAKNKAYIFLTDEEIKKKKDKITNTITRDRLGFNEDSFVGIEYHGQKRKWLNKQRLME